MFSAMQHVTEFFTPSRGRRPTMRMPRIMGAQPRSVMIASAWGEATAQLVAPSASSPRPARSARVRSPLEDYVAASLPEQ
ncbi:hypothetical protein GCM10009680_18030 [Streptomyces yatensis]|uniref:Uncharacterized protein n=1 Tax=Streptomyces yatensis TaxID=155177 RepID=A0ABN2GYL0_9ACTN